MVVFDFLGAVRENYAVAFLLVSFITLGIIKLIFNPDWLKKDSKIYNFILIAFVIIFVLFGIIRNLPGFEFLLPTYIN